MKFDFEKIPDRLTHEGVLVGDVYRAKGGRGDTKFWVVASVRGRACHAFGVDSAGDIVSTASYGTHVFAARDLVGRCDDLEGFTLPIRWEEE